jgi:hypothetical protein
LNPVWIIRKKRMKAWAKAHGVDVPKGLRVASPSCGAACRELIRRIERKAFAPTQASGVWSERLALLVAPRLTAQQRVVRVAVAEVGVKEHPAGSNSGKRVDEFTAVTGTHGQPWCAAFVTWCWLQIGVRLEGFNTAYCPSWVQTARAGRCRLSVVSRAGAMPGDMVLYDWGGDGTSDHIGVLTSRVGADGSFRACEGNTAVGNDSNGGAVMIRDRNASSVLVFVRVNA